ncbi:hypothetical protein TNCV_3910591 [Trichonephila clavipes]|nr:hypothetical protein TNCV_3910591 [Trichonephila clavipes]
MLLHSTPPQHNPRDSFSDRLPDSLDPLRPTVTYQGSHLRAPQCRPNAVFLGTYSALTACLQQRCTLAVP